LVEGRSKSTLDSPHLLALIVIGVSAILLTPLTNALESALTQLAITLGLDVFIKEILLPVTTRVVAVVLKALGFNVTVINFSKLLLERGGSVKGVGLLWNCVGWQTLIFFLIVLIVLLCGSYTSKSKIVCSVMGFDLVLFAGLLRILLVTVIDFYLAQGVAFFFRDYMGTIFVLAWVLFFCYLSYRYILERKPMEMDVRWDAQAH